MSDATDELVDVIEAELHRQRSNHVGQITVTKEDGTCEHVAGRCAYQCRLDAVDLVAALVERYGEPEIEASESEWVQYAPPLLTDWHKAPARRLVFPWQAVKEGDGG